MPKVLTTNDNVAGTVTRPIVFDVVRQIQAWTGIAPTKILFPGDAEVAFQPGSTIDEEIAFNRTSAQPLWKVSVREEHIADALLSTAVFQAEHDCYFEDAALGLRLRPMYSPVQLVIDFEFRSTDVTEAKRWRDEVRAHISNNRNVRSHIVNYHYFVPKEFLPLLEHMHTLRETQGGYGDTFDTYLRNHFAGSVTQISTLVGTEQRWAVAEQQGRVTGLFEFQELPDDPKKQGDNSAYQQTFSYRIYFDSPIATAGDYPVLVHNQLIDQKYLLLQPKDDQETFASRSPRSVTALGVFEMDVMAKQTVKSGLRLPAFHEFFPQSAPRYTLQVLAALVGVEENNRRIMSFNEIDENWAFRVEFIDHLKYDHAYLNRYGESLVNVTVYDEDMPLHHSLFSVDADLNVNLHFDPDIRRTYYVRLSLLTSMATLSNAAKDRARENAEGLILIGAALVPTLVRDGKLPKIIKDTNYVSRVEATRFFNNIDFATDGFRGGLLLDHAIVQWNTVMILYIETESIQNQFKGE